MAVANRNNFEQMPMVNKNIKFFLNWFFGPALFIWLTSSLYYQIQNQPNLKQTLSSIQNQISGDQCYIIPLVFVLMILNWAVEAWKWKSLLAEMESVSWLKSLKGVLAGVAFAINTPNRMGEYGGRLLYVSDGHRLDAVSLSIAGSLAQLLVTLWMGAGGLMFLWIYLPQQLPAFPQQMPLFWLQICLYMLIMTATVLTVLYFRISWLLRWIEKIPGISRYLQHLQVLENLHVTSLLRVFLLSLLRYGIFIIQYILMFELMQVTVSFWQTWWLTSVMFFVMAVIPSIALVELGIRGSVSVQLFGWFSQNTAGIIAVSVSMWLINLVIPALAGSLLVLFVRIFQQKEK
jgi:hypothetical protein